MFRRYRQLSRKDSLIGTGHSTKWSDSLLTIFLILELHVWELMLSRCPYMEDDASPRGMRYGAAHG